MKLLRPCFLALGLLAVFLAGCTSAYRLGAVSVTIVDFRPTDASLLESRGTLTLRYTNENIAPLGFSGGTHKLYLNGSYVGKAVSDRPIGIPPVNTVTQDIEVQFENTALIRQLLAVREQRTVAYRLESVLFQTIAEERYEVKTRSEGSLDLSALSSLAK